MKVIVLSSGSKGNTTYIEANNTRILIDAGNSNKYIVNKLEKYNIKPSSIDAILITHTHIDHIYGLKVFIHKYHPKIYLKEKMLNDLPFLEEYCLIENDNFIIKDLNINVINTSHDVDDSIGFIIENQDKSIVYITDTGYINKKYFDLLKNRNVYILESNHDIEMLSNGKYPFKLRQRILSDKGHLSNYDASKYLSTFITDNTRCIMLAHLSEENNTKELAYQTLIDRLNKKHQMVDKIIITSQNEETEVVEI